MLFYNEYIPFCHLISKGYFSIFKNQGIINTANCTNVKYIAWWLFTYVHTRAVKTLPRSRYRTFPASQDTPLSSLPILVSIFQHYSDLYHQKKLVVPMFELHIIEIMRYMFFSVWLPSLNIVTSMLWICSCNMFFSIVVWYSIVWLYRGVFSHSTFGEYLVYFQFGFITNKVTMNILVLVSSERHLPFGGHKCSFSLGICSKMKLLNHKPYVSLTLVYG